jgi:hypothetical protein
MKHTKRGTKGVKKVHKGLKIHGGFKATSHKKSRKR